ncbi:hypothetical protein COCCADRAFT_101200, partial [Bipolaris zeicola 26-R-13]
GLTGREAWRWRVAASVEERRALRLYSICIRAASRLASMRCNAARQGAGDSLLHALGRHTAIHIHIPTTAHSAQTLVSHSHSLAGPFPFDSTMTATCSSARMCCSCALAQRCGCDSDDASFSSRQS